MGVGKSKEGTVASGARRTSTSLVPKGAPVPV